MPININGQAEHRFNAALHNLTSLATTPEQLAAVESALLAREELDPYIVETLADVARFFGVEEQSVRTWRMRTDRMPGEPGKWPLDDIAKWLTRWRDVPETIREPTTLEKVKERLAELDLEEREKRLIDISEVRVLVGRTATVIRDGITALEQRYGSDAANIMRTPLERLRKEWEIDATK